MHVPIGYPNDSKRVPLKFNDEIFLRQNARRLQNKSSARGENDGVRE
jgi:hypothetical protein